MLAAGTDTLLRIGGALELGQIGLRVDGAKEDALNDFSLTPPHGRGQTLNGAMPELMKSSVGSSYGITDAEGTIECSWLSRKYWAPSQLRLSVHSTTDLQERLAHALGRPVAKLARGRARCHRAELPSRSLE